MVNEKICNNCGQKIENNAVICTSCGIKIKKPMSKKCFFCLFVAIIVLLAVLLNPFDNKQNIDFQETAKTENIEYIEYTITELFNESEKNILRAEEKYNNKNVELEGKLTYIDPYGEYIQLSQKGSESSFPAVRGYMLCYIKSDEQKEKILEFSIGEIVTVKGKIKSVRGPFRYELDIDFIN